jgi:hypothetical protein
MGRRKDVGFPLPNDKVERVPGFIAILGRHAFLGTWVWTYHYGEYPYP